MFNNANSCVPEFNCSWQSAGDISRTIDQGAIAYCLSLVLTVMPVGAIIITIISGNCLVIAAVLSDKRLKSQLQNWLIVSLAVADLLVGLVIMPMTLSYELLDYWPFGDELCEVWLATDVLFVTASILNLCAISLDRYWSLTNPVYYATRRTAKRTMLMIGCVWMAAFLVCCPLIVGWRPMTPDAPGQCLLSQDLGYVLYSSCGSFFIPVIILLFVYSRIYRITRRRAKRNLTRTRKRQEMLWNLDNEPAKKGTNLRVFLLSKIRQPETAGGLSCVSRAIRGGVVTLAFTADIDADPVRPLSNLLMQPPRRKLGTAGIMEENKRILSRVASSVKARKKLSSISGSADDTSGFDSYYLDDLRHSESRLSVSTYSLEKQIHRRRKVMRRRERQATYLLGLIVLAFVGCWMPFFCTYLAQAACCQLPDALFDIIFWLGYCNSALNPFIYNFFNPEFRQAFMKILVSKKRRVY